LKKRPKTAKSEAFTFRPFFATYFIFEKEGKNSKKVRLLPLLFVHFLPLISFLKKRPKTAKK
jgi:hypothetical protein